jgi:SAM-dependent methyltransferase
MTARPSDAPPLPSPVDLLPDAPRVRAAIDDAGWSAAALDDLLGVTARTHLDRGELAPVTRRLGTDPLSTLAALFVVGVPVEPHRAAAAGIPASWLRPDGTAACRLQPVVHDGREVLVPHDPPTRDPHQVIGVGAASLTLAAATPRALVGRTLDLGTGCGVQALLADDHSAAVVATDRNPRATAYAEVAALLSGADLDVREGDLLAPVAGEHFDLVVSNPPFVVSAGGGFTYRDAGLAGDEVCRRLVQQLPAHLAPGGVAVLLANWLHVEGEDGDARVDGWIAATGCDGWVVERELAAPEDYVTAWLRDGDEDFGRYDAWLDWFTAQRVEAVAFGILALRHGRGHGTGRVTHHSPEHPLAPTWGEQIALHFAAVDLLETDLLSTRLRLRDDVRLHQVARAGDEGWEVTSQLLQQEAGLRWSGGVDGYGATLLAGCDGSRSLGDLLTVLAASAGLGPGEAAEQVVPVVRSLVAQGFLVAG